MLAYGAKMVVAIVHMVTGCLCPQYVDYRQICRSAGCDLPQLEFRRQIAQTYLLKYKVPPKGAGRPATASQSSSGNRVSDDLHYDGIAHLVYPTEGNKRRQRAGERCSSVGRTECRKYGVGLCIGCFAPFHTS